MLNYGQNNTKCYSLFMQDIVSSLNDPQREAVLHTEGPLLVLAGAGTGKTRVLTTRLSYILMQGLAAPSQVLAVTFTNKAAKEMAERIEQMLGMPASGMWLGTFHSLGARILRIHAEAAGFIDRNFTILGADDQLSLCKSLLKDRGIDDTTMSGRQLTYLIGKWKDNGWLPHQVPENEVYGFEIPVIDLYKAYEKRLKDANAADFGDLLLRPIELFKKNPDILSRYQTQFKYVLVDEYQDTNTVQYLWLRLLVQTHNNICVVGDDDQSIYAWRGAQVGNILRFDSDFPGSKSVRLEQNYRSTGHILNAASGLIKYNEERHDKTLWTDGDDGDKVEVHPVFDDREEARFIGDRIESDLKGEAWDDFAILVRTAAQTRSIEERFIRQSIPYQVIGGLRFYERKEIRDAIAYLRLVNSPRDDFAFERVVNVPKRGMGPAAIATLTQLAREHQTSLFLATRMAMENGILQSRIENKLRPFITLIDEAHKTLETTSPDKLMENLLEDSGYLEMLRSDKDPDAKNRIDNLKELIRALQDFSDVGTFLEHISLVMDRDADSTNTVKITTVHAAKGLEFENVFLPGFEEGLFPHQRSLNEEGQKGLEEERRLAYVAVTRARKTLIISYAFSRRMYGQFQPATPSRFLGEMPDESLNMVSAMPDTGFFRPQVNSSVDRYENTEPVVSYKSAVEDSCINVGNRVFHDKFGYGVVKNSEGAGESARLTIAFDKAGQKKLVAGLAKLEVVR